MSESPKIRFVKSPIRLKLNELTPDQFPDDNDPQQHPLAGKIDSIVSTLEQVIHQLAENESRRISMMAEIRQVALDLSVVIANQLLFREIDHNPEILDQMFANILGEVKLDQPCEIRVHPDVASVLEECVQKMEDERKKTIAIVADPSVEIGSCLVNDAGNEFICSLPLRMYELQQIMNEEVHDAPVERRKNHVKNQNVKRFPDRRATG